MGTKNRFQQLTKWLILGCLLVGVFVYTTPVQAGKAQTSITPTVLGDDKRNVFQLIVEEGKSYTDTMIIGNPGSEPVRAFVFSGGYELRDNKIIAVPVTDNDPEKPGLWITIKDPEFMLEAKESRIVEFTINVPENADVGEHIALLLTQAGSIKKEEISGSGLRINFRTGTRVYMTVPGDISRDLVVENVGHRLVPLWKLFTKELKFDLNLRNDGNITLRPVTDLKVSGFFGEVGAQEEVPYSKIVRGSTKNITHAWEKRAPYFGRFVADFEIHLGEKIQVNKDGTEIMLPDEIIPIHYVFWIFPWIEIAYLLVLIFLLYLLRSAWLYYIIIGRLKTTTTIYTVKKDENLAKIANNLGIHPKRLVKFNMIPWPYQIETGDRLLIPTGKLAGKAWRSQLAITMKDKNIWSGVFGHLFKNKSVNKLTDRHIQPSGKALPQEETKKVIADKGDTIEDVAEFVGISTKELISLNKLKPPYRLKAGQELKVPSKKSKRRK